MRIGHKTVRRFVTRMLGALLLSLLPGTTAFAQEHFTGCAFNTGGSATVVIEAVIEPTFFDVPLEPGDEIAAFTESGICAGVVVWVGGETNVALTVWGDDVVTPEVDGFVNGEALSYRVWSTLFEIEGGVPPFDILVAYDDCDNRPPPCSDTGEYVGESLSFLSELEVPAHTTDIPVQPEAHGPTLLMYPNPVRDQAFLSISNWPDRPLDLVLLNALGQTVGDISTGAVSIAGPSLLSIDVASLPSGTYFIVVRGGGSRMARAFAVIK